MKTILDFQSTELPKENSEKLEFIEDKIEYCKNLGDFLGAGEWLLSKLKFISVSEFEEVISQIIALWAFPFELRTVPSSFDEIIDKISEFVPEEIAFAYISAKSRIIMLNFSLPEKDNDLSFRLSEYLMELFEIEKQRPLDVSTAACAKFDSIYSEFLSAINSFLSTNCTTAKAAVIEVLKLNNKLKKMSFARERAILGDIDLLLGPSFRKFCENCERQEMKDIIRRSPDIKRYAQKILISAGIRNNSVLWNLSTARIARHVLNLVNQGTRRGEEATAPLLKLASDVYKLDLNRSNVTMLLSCRLVNQGEGRASNIKMIPKISKGLVNISIIEPSQPFDMEGGSEQMIKIRLFLKKKLEYLNFKIIWSCYTLTGKKHKNEHKLIIHQQPFQPDWNKLRDNPPYTLNPIKKLENLFGRDTILSQLHLNVASGISTFLWGQKRVGKTSVLQVLADELNKTNNYVCIYFRMGELGPLHEGQLAHRIPPVLG